MFTERDITKLYTQAKSFYKLGQESQSAPTVWETIENIFPFLRIISPIIYLFPIMLILIDKFVSFRV